MKFVIPAVLALVINLILFAIMQAMTVERKIQLNDNLNAEIIDFVRDNDATEPPPERRREPPPEPDEPPPEVQPETFQPMATSRPSPMPMDALKLSDIPSDLNVDGPYIGPVLEGNLDLIMGKDMRAIYRSAPRYPRSLKRRKVEGEVAVEFTVNVSGLVENPVIRESTPPGQFDKAVLKAIQKWKFHPHHKNGKPVAVRVYQKIVFKLEK
jgi:protein TonB